MTVDWRELHDGLYYARRILPSHRVITLQIESLLEIGWDWHVSEDTGRCAPQYGLAHSLEEAQVRAEDAMDAMLVPRDKLRDMERSISYRRVLLFGLAAFQPSLKTAFSSHVRKEAGAIRRNFANVAFSPYLQARGLAKGCQSDHPRYQRV